MPANHALEGIELLFRGAIAGLAISAPVGPVNIFCISSTLTKGRIAGLIAGLGAVAADTLYGAVAGFSITYVISFLVREEFWIRFVGGLVLIGIGVVYYFKRPASLEEKRAESPHSLYVSAFLLNLTNPTTVLSFLVVLAALGLGGHRSSGLSLMLVAGIFAGGMLWWTILAMISGHFRDRINDRVMLWMNRIAAFAIGGFGIATMILSRGHPK